MSTLPPLPPLPEGADAKLAVEIWKTVVTVQQHFNDIELRIRNLAVTVLLAALGATALALREQHNLLAVLISVVGLVGWGAFWLMDQYWYHRFLKAAALHGARIENRWDHVLPELALSAAISAGSPVELTSSPS